MSVRQCIGIVAGILLALAGFTPVAKAQAMNESTQVTFREAIRIPGQVLPAGSYFFERANHGNAPNLNSIQIYNGDHTRLLATIETATTERKLMTGGPLGRACGRPHRNSENSLVPSSRRRMMGERSVGQISSRRSRFGAAFGHFIGMRV